MKEIRYPQLILACFALIAFFLPLPLAPLFDLDEGAFSEATREMLENGDYITTYLNGALRFDKPILIYWLQAVSVNVFGLNEIALRLPSAMAATLWAFAIYNFTKVFFSLKEAFFATLFMIAALQINLIAKAAIADALLNLFIALSMFQIYKYYVEDRAKHIYLAFLFIGLGTLTKGPVAIMIPLVVSLIFFALKGEWRAWLKAVFNPIGLGIFALVVLPWYIAEYAAQGQAFIDGFFLKHNISRFQNAMESHRGSFFYFIPVLLIGLMPFTALALRAIGKVKTIIKEDILLYLFIWFAFVFLFFSFSGTKLPHYVIYGYTPLFILTAVMLGEKINKHWLIWPLLILLVMLLFLPEIALFFKESIRDQLAKELIENALDTFGLHYRLMLILMIVVSIGVLLLTIEKEYLLISLAMVMIGMLNYTVIPTYGKLMQLPIKEAAHYARAHGHDDIVMYRINMPSFNVYYEGLVEKRAPDSGDIVLTKVTALNTLGEYETLYRKNGFILLKLK